MWYASLILKNFIPDWIIRFKIRRLLNNASQFLNDEEKLFAPISPNKEQVFKFKEKNYYDWLSKIFFTAWIMPRDHAYHELNNCMDFKRHLYSNGHVVSSVKPDADYSQIEYEELREAVKLQGNRI